MADGDQQRIRGYYTYFYGDTHEPPDERPAILDAEPVDDPSSVTPEERRRMFLGRTYPYATRMELEEYYHEKFPLQIELVKMQNWVKETGQRVVIVFEGRDAAGKGGTIRRFMEHLNPRGARVVALEIPTTTQKGQWYFQRYVEHFPTEGEIVLFDRSWYNRAGVERVMDFCTDEEYQQFLDDVPMLEKVWTRNGIRLIKLYFSVNRKEQQRRFEQRETDPLKQWKLSPVDVVAREKWDEYTVAKEIMFRRTHTEAAPWTVIKSDDKMRARINAMRHVLNVLPYDDKDENVVHEPDRLIVASTAEIWGVEGDGSAINGNGNGGKSESGNGNGNGGGNGESAQQRATREHVAEQIANGR